MKNKTLQLVSVILGPVLLATSFMFAADPLGAQTILFPRGGGTGSTTLSGILYGNGASAVRTVTFSSGLSFSGGTLTFTQPTVAVNKGGTASTSPSGILYGNNEIDLDANHRCKPFSDQRHPECKRDRRQCWHDVDLELERGRTKHKPSSFRH